MATALELKEVDRMIWAEELDGFVPAKLYDAHSHIYDWRMDSTDVANQSPPPAGAFADWPLSNWELLDQADQQLFPGREVHRIAFGNPLQLVGCSVEQANAFTAREVSRDDESIGLMLVVPEMSPEEVAEQAARFGLRGLKPYRTHAATGDAVECRITDYLPEPQIEVADRLGLMVMLHLSKSRAVADPDNLADLERLTGKYPRVRWVLAHCARSYFDRPLLQAADRLKNIPNLWYDISSVCDTDAMDVLLSIAGPTRVMYGSDDLGVGVDRGKYITFGHSWSFLSETNHTLKLSHCQGQMAFVRYESLRAFRRACRRHDYGPAEIERLFYSNARELIGLIGRPA